MNDFLFWTLAFVVAGIPALLLTRWIVRALERRRSDFAYRAIEALYADQPRPDVRARLMRMGKFALLLPIWPIAATALLVDVARNPERFPRTNLDEQTRFLAHGYLTEQLSVEVAQARESIVDPRGERPRQPFGYLWETWQRFLATRELGAELWAYEVPMEHSEKSKRLITVYSRGYCWVRKGKILHEFAVEGASVLPFGDHDRLKDELRG